MGLKMAKADKNDIDAAATLAAILGDIDRGYYPSPPPGEDGDGDPHLFDEDDPEHLRVFYDRVKACLDSAPGSIFRVIWGFITIMGNDVVDPDGDILELHPRIKQGLALLEAQEQAESAKSNLTISTESNN